MASAREITDRLPGMPRYLPRQGCYTDPGDIEELVEDTNIRHDEHTGSQYQTRQSEATQYMWSLQAKCPRTFPSLTLLKHPNCRKSWERIFCKHVQIGVGLSAVSVDCVACVLILVRDIPGFFYIKNHPIPQADVEGIFELVGTLEEGITSVALH